MLDLVDRNSKVVQTLAAAYFPNPTDREDAIQEARIKFMHVDGSALENEGGWTYTAVSNLFRDIHNKNCRTIELDQYASIGSGIDEQCPLSLMELEEGNDIVERKIEDLPDELSVTATMYYRKGMSYLQIAQELGVPEGTVASRMNTVRRYLIQEG